MTLDFFLLRGRRCSGLFNMFKVALSMQRSFNMLKLGPKILAPSLKLQIHKEVPRFTGKTRIKGKTA